MMHRTAPPSATTRCVALCALALLGAGVAGCDDKAACDPLANPSSLEHCLDAPPLPPLVENRAVYAEDTLDVIQLTLTVDDTAALQAVEENQPNARVSAVLHESGYFGEGENQPNAELELRGRSTRLTSQKSYKLHLTRPGQLWRGQREINLNKHPFDLTRVRQKLAFDLFRNVDHWTSLRTRFVHLVINGQSRGLYTWIEEPDRRFLASHGLDPDGALYKAGGLGFDPIPASVLDTPGGLDAYAEGHAVEDPYKLLRMIDAVNDMTADIDQIVNTYFQRQNYVTWLAINALVGNKDTGASNFYLYSPPGHEGWYFLPWDYDGALDFYGQPGQPALPRWRAGFANWWAQILHRRFLARPANVQQVQARMAELRAGPLGDAAISQLLTAYRSVVAVHTTQIPDIWHLPIHNPEMQSLTPEEVTARWNTEYDRLFTAVQRLETQFNEANQRPMPVHQVNPKSASELELIWTRSYDLQGDPITYDVEVATDPEFTNIIHSRYQLEALRTFLPRPAAGTYHWRVIIRDTVDPENHWQSAFHASESFTID